MVSREELDVLQRQIELMRAAGQTKFPIPITAMEKLMALVGQDVGWAAPRRRPAQHPDMLRRQANLS